MSLIGKTKYYNNRPVTILREEGHGFVFVAAELNLTHDQTGSNWCSMCQAGGDFISSHECEFAQEVIDHLMDEIEDHEVFWVSERYLNDAPFEFKPYKTLVDKIEVLKQDQTLIDSKIKESKSIVFSLELDIESKMSELSDLNLRIQQSQHDLMSATNEEPHQKLPDILITSVLDISTKEMLDLFESRMKLTALESGGVDNWEWYSESIGDTDFESEAIIELTSKLKK